MLHGSPTGRADLSGNDGLTARKGLLEGRGTDLGFHHPILLSQLHSQNTTQPKLVSDYGNPVALPRDFGVGLSEREIEIIEHLARGLTNQEIAQVLSISKRTVDNHVSNIFTKTGTRNRVVLVNWAMDHGKVCRDGFNCCNLPEPGGRHQPF